MNIEAAAIAGIKWFWDKYGKDLSDKAIDDVKKKWGKFKWSEAERKYRARMLDLHGTTRLLGHPKPIVITDIFSDVFVLDEITAHKRYDLEELRRLPFDRKSLSLEQKRQNIQKALSENKRLYILGKPGSGKTTLLKYLVIQCCNGTISKTPVFISLRDVAEADQHLIQFAANQFEVCGFPDANSFILQALRNGDVLILLDALDEVKTEHRRRIINSIRALCTQYPEVRVCMTCRLAASDYVFDNFAYAEIADFDRSQIHKFMLKWYQDDDSLSLKAITAFSKPEHENLKELAKTPLLLALLCLIFDAVGEFPHKRADLYREALEVLLRKWDASRGIERDDIYQNLSLSQKKKLLMQIAIYYFEKGVYFIDEEELARKIYSHLINEHGNRKFTSVDGDTVLRAIEAQHGLLVQRASGIYSFLHLTFQEYFTALSIIENISDEVVKKIFQKRLKDKRWDEVFRIAADILKDHSNDL